MRKICLVTTSRAEYGIQSRLIKKLQDDPDVDFSLIVSGMHLSKKHGYTYKEIEKDGINITKMFDIGIDTYGDQNIHKIMAKAIIEFTEALKEIFPEIVVVLGDRYEMLAAVLSCTLLNIPIAHLHGGETTEGATDEVFRHAITKASYLHFTSCEEYRRRVIQLGEDPGRVFNVGSLGVENTHSFKLMDKEAIASELGIKFSDKNILVTFHPVTFEKGQAEKQINELLKALGQLENTTIIFTKPNADAENEIIAKKIDDFVAGHETSYAFTSLGAVRYLSLAKIADAVVGNSSSGIIEVPSFKTATINIGDRQAGRLQAASVVNSAPDSRQIFSAVNYVYSPEYKAILKRSVNPYEKENTSEIIINILKSFDLNNALKKKFYDLRIS